MQYVNAFAWLFFVSTIGFAAFSYCLAVEVDNLTSKVYWLELEKKRGW